ncbi:DUF2231 domain-containing protein [Micromonospora sp. C95]|uniref:DUF2231 domain-containing protein n=1 Tax=Micromonospora sp. C95 TaxID=2824882 RepID=UPI001B36F61E|nr:hypothetical protein [Micromonospora sp. C95]MBQ1023970.1 hypothetical protein [Micromonospora sp. C95]
MVIFDSLYLITGRSGFSVAAGYMIAAGIIGGLVAALFGFLDLRVISGLLRARADNRHPDGLTLMLSFAGVALAGVTGWLADEMVERLGVGVDDGANVNAPSSLTHKHV